MTQFEKIVTRMLEIHKAKNHDYSAQGSFGNFAESEKVGIPAWKGAFVRLQDKYTRAANLIARDGQAMVLDEKLEDTLLDLANYAVIVLCLLQTASKEQPEKRGFVDEKAHKLSDLLANFPAGVSWGPGAIAELDRILGEAKRNDGFVDEKARKLQELLKEFPNHVTLHKMQADFIRP